MPHPHSRECSTGPALVFVPLLLILLRSQVWAQAVVIDGQGPFLGLSLSGASRALLGD